VLPASPAACAKLVDDCAFARQNTPRVQSGIQAICPQGLNDFIEIFKTPGQCQASRLVPYLDFLLFPKNVRFHFLKGSINPRAPTSSDGITVHAPAAGSTIGYAQREPRETRRMVYGRIRFMTTDECRAGGVQLRAMHPT
jgi:hypothetical protein